MSKELECLDRIDKRNYLTEREHKEFLGVVEKALTEYEAIKNAEPTKAMECLESMYARLPQWDLCRNLDQYNIIKQALLKAQEQKQFLKWEDLEFTKDLKCQKVKMNGKEYTLKYFMFTKDCMQILIENNGCLICTACDKQFFNDLHLERVQE